MVLKNLFSKMKIPFFFLLLLVVLTSIIPVKVSGQDNIRVFGKVIDNLTQQPIPHAKVIFWSIEGAPITVEADERGFYRVESLPKGFYTIIAYWDDASTPGFDYVPSQMRLSLEEEANVTFTLTRGFSIRMEGRIDEDLRAFESMEMVRIILFKVLGSHEENGSIVHYGPAYLANRILNISIPYYYTSVILPLDLPTEIEVHIYFNDGSEKIFTINGERFSNAQQGELISLDMRDLYLEYEVTQGNIYQRIAEVKNIIEGNKAFGFYVSYEENRVALTEKLIEMGREALSRGDYDTVFASLREAYLIIMDVKNALLDMQENSLFAVFFITPFLAFTAISLSHIFLDESKRRTLVSLLIYVFLFFALYVFHPGYSIFQKTFYDWLRSSFLGAFSLALLFAVSFATSYFLIFSLPLLFRSAKSDQGLCLVDALAAAFSISARNLRRRKLRSTLASLSLLISIFSFITLTSFSLERGLAASPVYAKQTPSTDGVLLHSPSGNELNPYNSIDVSIIQWLRERAEVTIIAPKVENIPQLNPIGTVLNPLLKLNFTIQGLIGILPSQEASVTEIDKILLKGNMLDDMDLSGILISSEASEALKTGLNETVMLLGRTFIVRGIFDGALLENVGEFDGKKIVPLRLIPAGSGTMVDSCSGGRVVIMHWEVARTLSQTIISRISFKASNLEDMARLAVLNWLNMEAYVCASGRITRIYVGQYSVFSGFTLMPITLILVVLNIGMVFLSSVYERKREVLILSTIGLNPIHITFIFIAEAVTIGVASGSIGYLLGLCSYRIMSMLGVPLGVKIKVEAGWAILALCLSIGIAALSSSLPASKASTIVTPSTLKRWKIEKEPRTPEEPWVLTLPLKIPYENAGHLFTFLLNRFRSYSEGIAEKVEVESAEWKRLNEPIIAPRRDIWQIRFTHAHGELRVATDNDLIFAERRDEKHMCDLILISKSKVRGNLSKEKYEIHQTASFVRRLVLEYTAQQKYLLSSR
jgi:ABC-type lipoprotein release transport system permease subunit